MPEKPLNFDRYHLTMAEFFANNYEDYPSVFYATQRKLPFAPCVGHEILAETLTQKSIGKPRQRFLETDKANLGTTAKRLASRAPSFEIRTVRPGTIVFASEPFADITGNFIDAQLMEISFEHAFDMPMTVAGNALRMRLAAGKRWLSDFSLRRDGDIERACQVAKYSYIGGFDDTSNMEAAFRLGINPVGTMAHFATLANAIQKERGYKEHFEEIFFKKWLDAHPKGTTLLIDTISVKTGLLHAIRAALSHDESKKVLARKRTLKLIRIDSYKNLENLIQLCKWSRKMLDNNYLENVGIMVTGDMDSDSIEKLVSECPFIHGFGIGTKLIAETKVAGVIFKICQINSALGGLPLMKLSHSKGKETIPGKVQIWRCVENNRYVMDIIAHDNEDGENLNLIWPWNDELARKRRFPLLIEFPLEIPSDEDQKKFICEEVEKFGGLEGLKNYKVIFSPQLETIKLKTLEFLQQEPVPLESGINMFPFPE